MLAFNVLKGCSLSSLLTPGQVLTHLDDVELHDSASYHHWDRYLLIEHSSSTKDSYNNLGYCIDQDVWEAQHSTCCERERILTTTGHMIASPSPPDPDASSSSNKKTTLSGSNHQVCYTNTSRSEQTTTSKISGEGGHCFDPSDLLHYSRCTETCKSSGQVCIHPAKWENLLRLTVHDISENSSKILFFRGDRRQLWSEVKVGRFRARWSWLQSVPVDFEMFWM